MQSKIQNPPNSGVSSDPIQISKIISQALNQNSKLSLEALVDTLIALFHETNLTALKRKHKTIDRFLSTYEKDIKEILIKERRKVEDFEELKLLGQGAFGCVALVRHKKSRKCYAMKTLNKNYTNKKGIEESNAKFMEERQILINGNSCPWVIQLHYAFQDKSNLYMVMEFMAGGDLVKLVERYSLPNNFLCFYAMEIILGIEAIHNMGFLHRDIKPDNILIDRQGHVKLGDFGTCVKLDANKMVRFERPVGTPDYVPPEFLQQQTRMSSYGTESDYWSCGIVLYELIYNDVPFWGDTTTSIYANIMNHKEKLAFPRDENVAITQDSEDFIRCLLTDRHQRYGQKGSTKEIRAHPWFNQGYDFTWETIRECPVPIPPELKSDTDTSYFDEVEKSGSFKENYDSNFGNESKEFTGSHLPFIGFSYNTLPGFEGLTVGDLSGQSTGKQMANGTLSSNHHGQMINNGKTLQNKIDTSDSNKENINSKELTETKNLLKQKEEENTKIAKEKLDLQKELNKERESLAKLRSTNRDLDVKVKTFEIRQRTMAIQNAQAAQAQAQVAAQVAAGASPGSNNNQQQNLKTISELQDKLKKLESEKKFETDKYNSSIRDKQATEFKLQQLEKSITSQKVNLSTLQRNLENSEQNLIEKSEKCKIFENKLKASEQNLNLHKSQFRVNNEKFQNLLNEKDISFKRLSDDYDMMKIKLSDAQGNVRVKEREKEDLSFKIAELENSLRKQASNQNFHQKNNSDITIKLSQTIKDLSIKQSQLEHEKRKIEDFQNKISLKEKEIDEVKRQRERDEAIRLDLTRQITEQQKNLTEMTMDYNKKSDEFENLKSEQNTVLENHKQTKIKLEQSEGQMRELSDELDSQQKFLFIYRNAITDLENQRAEWECSKESLEGEIQTLKKEFGEVKATIKENPELIFRSSQEYQEMTSKLLVFWCDFGVFPARKNIF